MLTSLTLLAVLAAPLNITATDEFAIDLMNPTETMELSPELDTSYGGTCGNAETGICHASCIDRNQDLIRGNYTLQIVTCDSPSPGVLHCGCKFSPPGPYYPPVFWPCMFCGGGIF